MKPSLTFGGYDHRRLRPCCMQDQHGRTIRYLMGWYMAPKYVVDNLSSFQPVDSMDAAHFKSPGTGCLLSRVTLTGDRELVAMGTAHFILGECNWTVKAFLRAEKNVYGNALNSPRRITIVDGGVALNAVHAEEYPQVTPPQKVTYASFKLKDRID